MKMAFNHRLAGPLLAVVLASAGLTGCGKAGGDPDDHPAAPAAEKEDAPAVPNTVTLDAEALQKAGLVTASPVATNWQAELTAYGTVLDSAPLQAELMNFGQAAMSFDRAHVELERAKVLKAQHNLSERAFLDAENTYKQNFLAVMTARFVIQTNWGGRIADLTGNIVTKPGSERKANPQLEGLTGQSYLVRVDLPAGERQPPFGESVRLVSLASQTPAVTGHVYDQLPTMDPQTQQQSLLCVADRTTDRTHSLIPGEAVTAHLQTDTTGPVSGVVVPASAVVRYEGAGWVYVQSATNRFTRILLPLDRPTADGWFVTEGLSATNRIIVTGVQTVLSAELSGGGFTTGERD